MDTIMIICDSVAMCVKKAADVCQPSVKDYGTNNNDIIIVAIICGTILIIAIVAIMRFFKWKDDERKANGGETSAEKDAREKKERAEKKSADMNAYNLSKKDHELKRKEELQDRLLSYLESRIKDGETIAEDDKYVAELTQCINAIHIESNDQKAQIPPTEVR